MPTPEQERAADALPRISRLADRYSRALDPIGKLLSSGALVGPAADRLGQGLADRYRVMRAALSHSFEEARRAAGPAGVGAREPLLGSPPDPAPKLGIAIRSGDPEALNKLADQLRTAGRAWENAGRELAAILRGAGLATDAGKRLQEAGNWVAEQAGDLQRRRILLQTLGQAPAHTSDGAGLPEHGLVHQLADQWVRHYLPGLGEGTLELAKLAAVANPATSVPYALVDFDGWLARTPVGMLQGLWQGIQDPVEFAKAVVNWDMWMTDPARASGQGVPFFLLSAATGGLGFGTRLGRAAVPDDPPPRVAAGSDDAADAARKLADTDRPAGALTLAKEQLRELGALERRAQKLADRYGVEIDFRTFPVDPENAAAIVSAMERMALEYPSMFRSMENIRVLSLEEIRKVDPKASSGRLAFSVSEGQKAPWPPGLYFVQENFASKAVADVRALEDHGRGWSSHPSSMTAKGTFYHEFGHQMGDRILADPALTRELAGELRKIGLRLDDSTLSEGYPPGPVSLKKDLGAYGAKDPREMISEAFAEWKLSDDPRPIASTIGSFIDKHYKGER